MNAAGILRWKATVTADLRHGTALWAPSRRFWPVVLAKIALYPRLRAVVMFRLAHELWQRPITRPVALWLQARVLRMCGAEIHPHASVGPGLLLVHSSGIVIHPGVTIGRDCAIYQGVTLGDRDGRPGQPVIGDRVRLGAGAVVLGPVHIGDDARVGAGALVLHDVAAGGVALGPPAVVRARQQSETA